MIGLTFAYALRGGDWSYGFGTVTAVDHEAQTITLRDDCEQRVVVLTPKDGFVPCRSWRGAFLKEVA